MPSDLVSCASAPHSKVNDATRLSGKCLNFLLVTFTFQSHICNSLFPFTKLPHNYADFATFLWACKDVKMQAVLQQQHS